MGEQLSIWVNRGWIAHLSSVPEPATYSIIFGIAAVCAVFTIFEGNPVKSPRPRIAKAFGGLRKSISQSTRKIQTSRESKEFSVLRKFSLGKEGFDVS